MDRQPGLVLDVFIGCLVPFFVGMAELSVVADLVLLADVGDPAVEGVERRAVAQESRFAERAVEVDLDRGTASVSVFLPSLSTLSSTCRLRIQSFSAKVAFSAIGERLITIGNLGLGLL